MHVSESQCNPQVCRYECQIACSKIHGDDSAIGFGKESLIPLIDEETCDVCLACVRACPLNAISSGENYDAIPEPIPPPSYDQSDDKLHRIVKWLKQHTIKLNRSS